MTCYYVIVDYSEWGCVIAKAGVQSQLLGYLKFTLYTCSHGYISLFSYYIISKQPGNLNKDYGMLSCVIHMHAKGHVFSLSAYEQPSPAPAAELTLQLGYHSPPNSSPRKTAAVLSRHNPYPTHHQRSAQDTCWLAKAPDLHPQQIIAANSAQAPARASSPSLGKALYYKWKIRCGVTT